MKKFFKNPDEAKKSDAPSVMKILKKVFSKGVEGDKFFYKAEFDYEKGDTAPFMFIGAPAGPWKKYIKDSKKDKDFVAGLCKLEIDGSDKKLLLQAKMGKGSKALFLKAINKQLLKKLSIKAEFVDELTVALPEEEEEATPDSDTPVASRTPEELSTDLKEISTTFKAIRAEHNADQIDGLLDKISDWEDNYAALTTEQKQNLAPSLANAQKAAASLQKINQMDSRIDQLFEKIMPLLEAYVGLDDHSTSRAIELKGKAEKAITKVEGLAQKINDNAFVEICQEFRKELAS